MHWKGWCLVENGSSGSIQVVVGRKGGDGQNSDDHGYGKPVGLPGMGLAGAGTGDYI